jgi:hypothetical protein
MNPGSYSLSSLMLLVTWCSVCFGLLAAVPLLGVPACLLTVPALIRTGLRLRAIHLRGAVIRSGDRISIFIESLAVVIAIPCAVGGIFVCIIGTFVIAFHVSNDAGIVPLTALVALLSLPTCSLVTAIVGWKLARAIWNSY